VTPPEASTAPRPASEPSTTAAPVPIVPAPKPTAASPAPETPEPSTATAATVPSETNGTDLSLDRVVAAWPAIVEVLSRLPVIKPLILTCRPVALDGVIVTLGFPEEQAFLREIAERKKANIEAGIREVIGHDVGVRCIVANIEVPAPATGGDDGFLMAEARRIFGDDLADVVEID
jgi:DNA polymerase-3 subunit gamma/tau